MIREDPIHNSFKNRYTSTKAILIRTQMIDRQNIFHFETFYFIFHKTKCMGVISQIFMTFLSNFVPEINESIIYSGDKTRLTIMVGTSKVIKNFKEKS